MQVFIIFFTQIFAKIQIYFPKVSFLKLYLVPLSIVGWNVNRCQSQSKAMAANFKVKIRQDFEWIAEVVKPSNQLTDLETEVRKAKSMSGIWQSLQIG